MSDRIRFHLDEHVPSSVAAALQQRCVDVTTTVSAGLRTASDTRQIEFARSQRRALVTNDAGFLRLHASGQTHPGIVYCRASSLSIGDLIRALVIIWEVLSPAEMNDHVEFL